jgi:3'-phosphoadenosine 5'-phosphosulfate sulfotransferase (PAPS reductase)/FAD synthetase
MVEEGMPIDVILFCDTGLEFPEMYDHIRKVEEYIGRKITILKSEKDFMWWATEYKVTAKTAHDGVQPGETYHYGWPNRLIRYCTRELKTYVIRDYLTNLRKSYQIVQYCGIAYDEPNRIKDLIYPLVTWKMTEADCLQYCYERGFDWGGLYEIWDRVSCWCCPLQSRDALKKLRDHRPHLWRELKEMDETIREKAILPYFQGYASLSDIERRFEVEDEFVAQGKKLRTKEFFQTLRDRGITY